MVATCWTLIEDAASGVSKAREDFAASYSSVLSAYFGARWRGGRLAASVGDAVQEVFLECLKDGGLLEKADRGRGGFRPFLYGAARRVASRFEEGRGQAREKGLPTTFDTPQVDEAGLATVFDRAWAASLMRQARTRMAQIAETKGEREQRRVELLRLRFEEGRPIRDIAKQWNTDAAELHHEFAKARREFRSALLEVVAFHTPGSEAEVEAQARELIALVG